MAWVAGQPGAELDGLVVGRAVGVERRGDVHGRHHGGDQDPDGRLGQVATDADAAAKAEGPHEERLAVAAFRHRGVAVRVEGLGVLVDAGVAAHGVAVVVYVGALGDEHAVVNVVLERAVGNADGRQGTPARGLLDNVVEVAQLRAVGERGQAVSADDAVELSAGLGEDVRILHEVEEGDGGSGVGLAISGLNGTKERSESTYCVGPRDEHRPRSTLNVLDGKMVGYLALLVLIKLLEKRVGKGRVGRARCILLLDGGKRHVVQAADGPAPAAGVLQRLGVVEEVWDVADCQAAG